MKKIYPLIVMLLLITGCSNQKTNSSLSKKEYKIGVIAPLTGLHTKVGEDVRTALKIAEDTLHKTYPNIHIIYEDSKFEPTRAVTAFHKLVQQEQVDAIIGPFNGSSIEAVKPLANQYQIPTITPWGGANQIDSYLLKNSLEVDDETRALAELMVKKLELKKLAVMYMQNDFGLLNDKEFRKHVEDLGGQVVISQVASFGNLDYRSELTKIKEAHVDGIYFVLNGAHLSQTTKQALELEIDLPYFGMYGTESSDMLALGGTSLEGLIYTFTLPDEKNFTEKQKKFLEDFAKTTGWIPQAAAYGAYDIYDMLLHGFDHCEENNEPSCVGTFIKSHTWDGVSGKYWYEGNEVKRDLYLKIIQNGKFQQYSP